MHEIAARPVQPVDHIDLLEALESFQRRHPRIKNLDAADRAILVALLRRHLSVGPWRMDAPDEEEAHRLAVGLMEAMSYVTDTIGGVDVQVEDIEIDFDLYTELIDDHNTEEDEEDGEEGTQDA